MYDYSINERKTMANQQDKLKEIDEAANPAMEVCCFVSYK